VSTFAELRQEVIDRGYDYTQSARISSSLQRAYQMLCARYPWHFLETSATGAAPLEIADLRKVLSVSDTTTESELRGADRRWLVSIAPSLSETGTPTYWYLENLTLKVYPASTADSLSVRYIKRPTALADSDEPLIPSEWQYLMVDLAVVDRLKDDDEYEQARALASDIQAGVAEMVHALLNPNYQNSERIMRTGRYGDYL
jgi:hypothetical protein